MEKGPPPQRIVQELPKERKARLAVSHKNVHATHMGFLSLLQNSGGKTKA